MQMTTDAYEQRGREGLESRRYGCLVSTAGVFCFPGLYNLVIVAGLVRLSCRNLVYL